MLDDIKSKSLGFEAGGVDYITKPVQKEDLLARVGTHLENYLYKNKLEEAVKLRTVELVQANKRLSKEFDRHKKTGENLRVTLNSIGDAVIATDTNGCIVRMNPVAEELTGWQFKAANGKSLTKVFNIFNAQTGEKVDNPVKKVIKSGKIVGLANHTKLIAKDGTEYQIADSAAPIRDAEGAVNGIVLVFRDVTEDYRMQETLQESEERYRLLVEGAQVSIALYNCEGQLNLINAIGADNLGGVPNDFIGKPLSEFLDLPIAELMHKRLQDVIASGELVQVEDTFELAGRELSFLSVFQPLTDAAGVVVGVQTISHDITERKHAEEERMKLSKLESLGILAGGIAHDFNNLLTGIFSNVELANMFISSDHKAHNYLKSTMASMERAAKLTQQLLTFAKGGEPIKQTIALDDVIIETAEFSLHGSNVKLETRIPPVLWYVEADKGQLSQVISNLVINAQQAMPKGGTFTIGAENMEIRGERYVQIRVQDEGVGIPPQYLDNIFDPYFSTKQKGSGLGLASSHSIISKHNGRIQVESYANQGTTFTIQLPATTKTMSEPSLDEATNNSIATAHILVLDDDEVIRKTAGSMLETMGHQVDFAVDGQEAISKYQAAYEINAKYDLIITDLTILGGMGGQEAAQEILKINPQAKLIVSSGYATNPVMSNFREYGFSGIVVKPYRFAELRKVLEQVLTL